MWVSLLAEVYESRCRRALAFGHGEEKTAFEAVQNRYVSRNPNVGFQLRLTHWLTRSMAIERCGAGLSRGFGWGIS